MFLLALETDAACTSWSGYSARSVLLVLVWCYKARVDREQYLWRYWLTEGCIKQCYDKPMGDGYLCKKCGLGEEWRIDIAVSGTLAKCSDVQYGNSRFRNISDQQHLPESLLM